MPERLVKKVRKWVLVASFVHFFSKKETNQRKLPGNLLLPAYLSFNGAKTFSAYSH